MRSDYLNYVDGDVSSIANTISYMLNSDLYKRDAEFRKKVDNLQAANTAIGEHVRNRCSRTNG